MTNRELNERFELFRECCDSAPAGTYEAEKELRGLIGDAVDSLARDMRRLFGKAPNNCDGAHHVEATIYAWLTRGSNVGATAEGFGRGCVQYGPEVRERIIAQAARDRDALAEIRGLA